MITIIVASSALPMLPNGTPRMCINVNERDDDDDDDEHHDG